MGGGVTCTSPVVRAVVNGPAIGFAEAPAEHVVAGEDVLRGQLTNKVVPIEAPVGVARDFVSFEDHAATLNSPHARVQSRKAPTDEVSTVGAHRTDADAAFGGTAARRENVGVEQWD